MALTYSLRYQDSSGRWIHTQNDEQKLRALEIIKVIKENWKPHTHYYHFRDGGHIKALSVHLENSFFLKADIHDFFYQVTRAKIARALKKIGFKYSEAASISHDSTVRNPRTKSGYIVPFGFSQSPLIATLVFQKSAIGNLLKNLTKRLGVTVSVYMDDILISADEYSKLEEIKNSLVDTCLEANFPLNPAKLVGPTDAVEIFNINIAQQQKRITDERIEEFRLAISNADNPQVVDGIIGYVKSVNSEQAVAFTEESVYELVESQN